MRNTPLPSFSSSLDGEGMVPIGRISIPTALSLFSRVMISMLFLGYLGELELAGGSLSIGFANITGYSILSGLAMGMEPIWRQTFGARQRKLKLFGLTLRPTVLLLTASLPISLLWLNMETILLMCGQDDQISRTAQLFLRSALPDLALLSLLHPLIIYLRRQNITRPLTYCSTFSVIVHIPLNYLLVVHFKLGISGVAMAMVLANLNLLLCLICFVYLPGVCTDSWVPVSADCLRDCTALLRPAVRTCVSVCLEWWRYGFMSLLFGLLVNRKAPVAVTGTLIQTIYFVYIFPSSRGIRGAPSLSPSVIRATRSLSPADLNTSFRIGGGVEGDVDLLGLAGPEDFAIPAAPWAALKFRSSPSASHLSTVDESVKSDTISSLCSDEAAGTSLRSGSDDDRGIGADGLPDISRLQVGGDRGIRGARPPLLSPPYITGSNLRSPINTKFRGIIGSWDKGELLGSGSFGTVYKGISNDGFFFAVKEVSLLDEGTNAKQCIFQLEQEIALLSQFEHENIVQYYGTDKEQDKKLFIFLELVTQGSLASLCRKYNLKDSQVSAYTRQILSGLTYLHERNVVHRDIKCANILVHANGSVKLADFGLAKQISKLNVPRSCHGSAYWMAPEVFQEKPYGPSADIWSLGCTVLEMLTRQVPYPNLEPHQALFRIGRGEKPVIPDTLSDDARDFISQCVQVNSDDRPSASMLLEHSFVRRPLPASDSSDGFSHGNRR